MKVLRGSPLMLALPRGRKVVLCVDDDEDQLSLRTAVLQLWGYDVITASNGRTALLLLKRIAVDLVLLDYEMPNMNGTEVATAIRKRWSQLPILGLSGRERVELPAQFLRLINGFIHKGSPPGELLLQLENLSCYRPLAA